MFIGHFALGYAAKRWAPHLSLAVLFAAAIFADLLWPVLVALGIEHVRIAPGITASTPLEFISYPYSHSLLTLTLLGALFGWLSHRTFSLAPRTFAAPRFGAPARRRSAPHPSHPVHPLHSASSCSCWSSATGCSTSSRTFPTCRCILTARSSVWGCGIRCPGRSRPRRRCSRSAFGFTRARRRRATPSESGRLSASRRSSSSGFVVNANGTPPPSVTALWMMALGLGALTLWLAWFADRHRTPRT